MKEILSTISLDLILDKKTALCVDDQSRKCNSLYNNLLEVANDKRQKARETGDKKALKILYSVYGLRELSSKNKRSASLFKKRSLIPLKERSFAAHWGYSRL